MFLISNLFFFIPVFEDTFLEPNQLPENDIDFPVISATCVVSLKLP